LSVCQKAVIRNAIAGFCGRSAIGEIERQTRAAIGDRRIVLNHSLAVGIDYRLRCCLQRGRNSCAARKTAEQFAHITEIVRIATLVKNIGQSVAPCVQSIEVAARGAGDRRCGKAADGMGQAVGIADSQRR